MEKVKEKYSKTINLYKFVHMRQLSNKIETLPLRGWEKIIFKALGSLLLWALPIWLSAQTSTQNYIVTTVPYQAVSTTTTLTDANSNTKIQYFDGLGRPSQTVQRAITFTASDLVSGIEYDGLGRDYRHWLPGKVAGNNGAYVNDFGLKQRLVTVEIPNHIQKQFSKAHH